MDWDEDGLKDLLTGENNGQVRYYRNIGTPGNPSLTYVGVLMVGGTPIDIGSYSHPWVDDWNEDGMKDLLVGSTDGRIWLYINEGTNQNPVFNSTQYITLATGAQVDFGSRSGPMVVDFNGDNVKDLVSGDISGKIFYCQNNGTNAVPLLANPVALKTGTIDIQAGSTCRAAPVDWDEDGDYDIVSGAYSARLFLYKQTATTPPAPIMDLTLTSGYSVPASGGTVTYTFAANNTSGSTVNFDAWTDVQLPNRSYYGPLLSRSGLSLPPGGNLSRSLNQFVPGGAPAGSYYYYGFVGNQTTLQVYTWDYFYFYKTGLDGAGTLENWNCDGWLDECANQFEATLPDRLTLSAAPNPFNPVTTLSFDLPEASVMSVKIYNSAGQTVATLVDGYRAAGKHEITWIASDIPSGVYFASIQTGTANTMQKIVLLK